VLSDSLCLRRWVGAVVVVMGAVTSSCVDDTAGLLVLVTV
jgi:hypothetical protein